MAAAAIVQNPYGLASVEMIEVQLTESPALLPLEGMEGRIGVSFADLVAEGFFLQSPAFAAAMASHRAQLLDAHRARCRAREMRTTAGNKSAVVLGRAPDAAGTGP